MTSVLDRWIFGGTQIQRWIESQNGEQPRSATKEFLLPEGEGQDEGKPRSMTQRTYVLFHRLTESSGSKKLKVLIHSSNQPIFEE